MEVYLQTSEDLRTLKKEIESYYDLMEEFKKNPDLRDIFLMLSGFSSRASHIRSSIVLSDDTRLASFRIKQIDPFISECDRQFKIYSRIASYDAEEYKLSGKY